MNLHDVKIEALLPVFLGCLSALILCALMVLRFPAARDLPPAPADEAGLEEAAVHAEEAPETAAHEEDLSRFFAGTPEKSRDLIQEMYRKPDGREWVIQFFAELCKSREIAEVILANADEFDIIPSLAFALSWEESRFNPSAVNLKNRDESIDRGLFQLNDRSFPRLEINDFFDPRVNARHGMGHLRFCLETGGSEIAAIAMYNAGTGKVKNTGAPKMTLDYIHRIMENRRKIDARFNARLLQEMESPAAEKSGPAYKQAVATPEAEIDLLLDGFSEKAALAEAEEPARPRIVLLAPLRGE